jgi:hypothetical protein
MDEIQQPCKDGRIIWFEVSNHIQDNKQGEIEVVGVSRNIDVRKNRSGNQSETNRNSGFCSRIRLWAFTLPTHVAKFWMPTLPLITIFRFTFAGK